MIGCPCFLFPFFPDASFPSPLLSPSRVFPGTRKGAARRRRSFPLDPPPSFTPFPLPFLPPTPADRSSNKTGKAGRLLPSHSLFFNFLPLPPLSTSRQHDSAAPTAEKSVIDVGEDHASLLGPFLFLFESFPSSPRSPDVVAFRREQRNSRIHRPLVDFVAPSSFFIRPLPFVNARWIQEGAQPDLQRDQR